MDMTKIAEMANPAVTALLGGSGIWAWVAAKSDRNDAENKLLLKVAKNQLVKQGRKYLKRGYITMDEYEEYESEFKVYEVLGGNGLASRVFKQVDDLPILPNNIDGKKN